MKNLNNLLCFFLGVSLQPPPPTKKMNGLDYLVDAVALESKKSKKKTKLSKQSERTNDDSNIKQKKHKKRKEIKTEIPTEIVEKHIKNKKRKNIDKVKKEADEPEFEHKHYEKHKQPEEHKHEQDQTEDENDIVQSNMNDIKRQKIIKHKKKVCNENNGKEEPCNERLICENDALPAHAKTKQSKIISKRKVVCKPGKCSMKTKSKKEISSCRQLITKPRSAWTCYIQKNRLPNEDYASSLTRLKDQWHTLKPDERLVYQNLAHADKLRFEFDLRNLNLDEQKLYKNFVKKRKMITKESHPKMNGYMMFVKNKRLEIIASNPELNFASLGKELGKQWGNLSPQEKLIYNELATKHKAEKVLAQKENQQQIVL